MTLTLSVFERELLKTILPQQGGRIEMRLVKCLFDKLEYTPEEITQFELRDTERGIEGNPKMFVDREFELDAATIGLLKPLPDKLNEDGRVTLQLLPLLDKIDELKV